MLDDVACVAGFPAAAALASDILQSFKGDSEIPLEQFLQQMRSTGPCNNACTCMCDQIRAECATIQTS
jgi:alkylated DNA nucleotide flippase Atl1